MIIRNDLSGKKVNRLTVIRPIQREKYQVTKYLCICDCGKETVVRGSKITNGHTKSCGCFRDTIDRGNHKLPKGEANKNALIYNYKHNAKYKGHVFDLTNEEMIFLFQSNCYYCGTEPIFEFKKKGSNGAYKYNGIDRLDSDRGYMLDNVVSCCSKCNYIKNKFHHDNFVSWIEKVYLNLKVNGVIL